LIPATVIATSRGGPRLNTWAMAAVALALACIVLMRTGAADLRQAVRVAVPVVQRYLRWFWRLSIAGKVAATTGTIVIAYLAVRDLPLPVFARRALSDSVALALVGLLLVSILFGSAKRQRSR
jgi:hypothetical protein